MTPGRTPGSGRCGAARHAAPSFCVLLLLCPAPLQAVNVTAVTVDLSTNAGSTWTTGVAPGTVMRTGDWVRVHLTIENDTGLLGNATVDTAFPPPDPTAAITADQMDCAANNNGAAGDWPSQYWVWPSGGASCAPCRSGFYPAKCSAVLSLVSAEPILTFDYNGYTYAPGAPNNTATVAWVFRIEQAADVDLDLYAANQDDDAFCWSYGIGEGSYTTCLPGCGPQGDGTCRGILASLWGGTISPVPALSVTAAAVVTNPGTRPGGVAYVGDTIEITADATNSSAVPATVSPGDAYMSAVTSGTVCLFPFDPAGGCGTGSTVAGSPALPVTIGAGASRQFTWTTSVAGSGNCAGFTGCTTGGSGNGSASWTALILKSPATAGLAVEWAPLAITATVWVDPDGSGGTYTPVPLGVVTAGTNNAGPYYYMGKETLETRFTYRNTSGETLDISPGITAGGLGAELELVSGPVPPNPQTLGPFASATVTWTWRRRPGGWLDGCSNSPYGVDFTTAVRGRCFAQPVQLKDVPFRPYDACGGAGCPPGSRNLTFTVPSNAATGDDMTVVLHATNPDNRPFVLDAPPAVLWVSMTPVTGNATLVSSPGAPPYEWAAKETRDFIWHYTASSAGTVRFCAGLDFLAFSPPCHQACRQTPPYCGDLFGEVTISTPGVLTITGFTVDPAASCADDETGPVLLQMSLRNSGPDCVKVTGFCTLGYPDPWPALYAWDAASPPAPAHSPSPAVPFTIPAGGSRLVTWYMDTLCPEPTAGQLSFDCKSPARMVQGEVVDCGTGAVLGPVVADLTAATTPPPVTVTAPAYLSGSAWTDRSQYSVGQVITVFFSVSNEGGNAAQAFLASVTPNTLSGAQVSLTAGPSPAVPGTYPGSGKCTPPATFASRETFVWQYTALARGFVSFTGNATGTDGVCGASLLASATTQPKASISDGAGLDSAILAPAVPVVTMTVSCTGCAPVSACDPATGAGCLDVVLAASNLGGVTLGNVTVSRGDFGMLKPCSPGTCAGTGAAAIACPAPACEPAEATLPGTIGAGLTRNFTWRYTPTALGCVRANVQISGNDGATGAPLLQSHWGPCVRIVPRYPLELAITRAPARVAPGQCFKVAVHACNPGETSAGLQGGEPGLQFLLGGAPVTGEYDTAPPPLPSIPPGECRDIEVNVTAHRDATPGDVTIRLPQGSVYVGIDAETGLALSVVDTGNPLTVRVTDPRSRLLVTGPHPVHILREPALIEYVLADAGRGGGRLTLRLYTLSGELVRTLVNKTAVVEDAVVAWDGRNDSGQLCASGVYLARLEAPGFSATAKVAMLK